MNKPTSNGVNLVKVIFAVLILTVSALLTNTSVAEDKEVKTEQAD
jgi:hypothetical protein